jgi:AcrR family transcriptional regulator
LPSPDERHALGLRERKKARTKAAIQHHALRLIQAQGYAETTVEQIAAAAEISPSTFFRYFPTKEDVVLYDDLDPIMIAAYRAQPPEMGPIQAMRAAMRAAFASLPADETMAQVERARLVMEVPDLRMRMLDQIIAATDLLARMIAERTGRDPHEFELRVLAGAILGALLGAMADAYQRADFDFVAAIDDSLRYLEAGLPLSGAPAHTPRRTIQ